MPWPRYSKVASSDQGPDQLSSTKWSGEAPGLGCGVENEGNPVDGLGRLADPRAQTFRLQPSPKWTTARHREGQ